MPLITWFIYRLNMRLPITTFCALFLCVFGKSLSQTPVERFLSSSYLTGSSLSFLVKDMARDSVVFSYDADRELIPASVLKLVTTATALEILGEQFRFETSLLYSGVIRDSVLEGNLYVRGSGDPTLGSAAVGGDRDKILREWVKMIKRAGIRTIAGSVISDESIFDSEGVSMKWLREDMGNYYSQGSYGINIFDNHYTLFLRADPSVSTPEIIKTEPPMPMLRFYNYLLTNDINKDSMYITGFPFSNERYLYGTIPANRSIVQQQGDIPDPSLFFAQYFTERLKQDSVNVRGEPSCYRILSENNDWKIQERKLLTSSYSISLKEMIRITNHVSHNLYADALLKTVGITYRTSDPVSSFDRGIVALKSYWKEKGLNTDALWMYDGCGLATSDKLSASFLCELLTYMHNRSSSASVFMESLPRAGREGTVVNLLRGSELEGKARLKSGSMSRVRSYAGYLTKDGTTYAVVLIVNNFSCTQAQMRKDIERLFLSFF